MTLLNFNWERFWFQLWMVDAEDKVVASYYLESLPWKARGVKHGLGPDATLTYFIHSFYDEFPHVVEILAYDFLQS